jgi:hypothetical protein
MPNETVTVVLTFRDEATRSDRDSDIAYLHQFFEPLLSECSSFKTYQIHSAFPSAGND